VLGAPLALHVDQRTGIAFITIPAGEFDMGAEDITNDEKPIHRVRLTKPFLLGKYAVTNQEYQRFLEANPGGEAAGVLDQQPVQRSAAAGGGCLVGRGAGLLPVGGVPAATEAEWEYACRAGSQGRYCFGDDEGTLGEYAWYGANSGQKTHPVGQKKPNVWGLYDMHGNVWEWCENWYGAYPKAPMTDPPGACEGPVPGAPRRLVVHHRRELPVRLPPQGRSLEPGRQLRFPGCAGPQVRKKWRVTSAECRVEAGSGAEAGRIKPE